MDSSIATRPHGSELNDLSAQGGLKSRGSREGGSERGRLRADCTAHPEAWMGVKVLSFLTVEKQSEPLALRPSPPNHSEGRTNFLFTSGRRTQDTISLDWRELKQLSSNARYVRER